MLQLAFLNENLALAPQISPDVIAEIQHAGFEQIICNRPDNEETFQPTIASIQTEAKKQGVEVTYAPVADSQFTPETITQTRQALERNKKTLMFCRTGTRCSILWSMIQVQNGASPEDCFRRLSPIGYDIAHMQDFIVAAAHAN